MIKLKKQELQDRRNKVANKIKKFSIFEAPLVEKKVVFTFGRFNPPTTGHEKLIDKVKSVAGSDEYRIYPSQSQNQNKDPLPYAKKVAYMRKMFPKHKRSIAVDKNPRTAIDIATTLYGQGYRDVTMVVGSDRVKEFERLLKTYNGVGGKRHGYYKFDSINVVSAGERDPDAEGVEGMSASKMRKAATEDDFQTFRSGIPNALDDKDAKALFALIKKQMGTSEKKEVEELWQIAPKLDMRNLRENYVADRIYSIGDIVESLNTGLIGEVIRRGTNHLICLTQESLMFKSWIKDVSEAVTNSNAPSGVPADQRLVGTDAYRKYVEKLVPGSERGKQFINKYRKK